MYKAVNINLYQEAFYTQEVTLEGQTIVLAFSLNERQGTYSFSVYDGQENPVVTGMRLLPNVSLAEGLLGAVNLTGYFFLFPLTDKPINFQSINPEFLRDYYGFAYIHEV